MKKVKMKITVLKRNYDQELVDKYSSEKITPCSLFTDGQEFVTEGLEQPEGFCSWAWNDIHKCFLTLTMDGEFSFMKAKNNIIACCTDGIRPVVFNIERME